MSEARTKPSRIVRQVVFTTADLPSAANNSLTASITGLPSRGIIHRVSAHMVASGAFPTVASSVDGLFVHRVGTDGVNEIKLEHVKSMVCAYALDLQTGGLAGSASLFATNPNGAVLSRILSPASSGVGGYTAIDGGSVATGPVTAATVGPVSNSVAYDIYGADAGIASTAKVLGPNSDQATLHFTVISGGSDFKSLLSGGGMWIEVEIEPCF